VLPGILALAFAVVWVPSHLRARCGGDEANMIGVLRSINSAQEAYLSSCADSKGFAASWAALATPPPGGSSFVNTGSRVEHVCRAGARLSLCCAVAPQRPHGSDQTRTQQQ
jgi:hypothetical protein